MFFRYVKAKWEEGKVSVLFSAEPGSTTVYLRSSWLTKLALMFLTSAEKEMIGELSKSKSKGSITGMLYPNDFNFDMLARLSEAPSAKKSDKPVRVGEIFNRINSAPPATSRDTAHALVKSALESVEDEYTNLPQGHPDRMRFFSLGMDIWVDEDSNPTHVKLNNYRAFLYDDGRIVINRINPPQCLLDKPGEKSTEARNS